MSLNNYKIVTYEEIVADSEIRTYIEKGDRHIGTMGYTEHSFAHVKRVSKIAADILTKLGDSNERVIELARIAGYMHDIGNVVNRIDHAQTGAIMAFQLLSRMNMSPSEIASVAAAIGNHDEETGTAVNSISAALILADKTDVRRSRVRNRDRSTFDIHDRVNFAVENSETLTIPDKRIIRLILKIDTDICSLMDYFEIFLTRMMMCRRAADFLNATFELVINGTKLM